VNGGGMRSCSGKKKLKKKKKHGTCEWPNLPAFETGNRRGRFKLECILKSWKLGSLKAKTLCQSLCLLEPGRRL
jgi:hypothetical protein